MCLFFYTYHNLFSEIFLPVHVSMCPVVQIQYALYTFILPHISDCPMCPCVHVSMCPDTISFIHVYSPKYFRLSQYIVSGHMDTWTLEYL